MSTHHRKCRSNGGSNAPRNLSKVPQKKHRAYHLLFGNSDARAIAAILNETWIDPDFRLVAIRVKDK